jgi:hypothetical protein
LDRVIRLKHAAKLTSSFFRLRVESADPRRFTEPRQYLCDAGRGQPDSMVRNILMNIAILVSFRLGMSHQDYHLCHHQIPRIAIAIFSEVPTRGLPMPIEGRDCKLCGAEGIERNEEGRYCCSPRNMVYE